MGAGHPHRFPAGPDSRPDAGRVASAGPTGARRAPSSAPSWPKPASPALRLGVSGSPGVGKSTFIDAAGEHWASRGRRVAVLAIDPSSPSSGGSILGDKTRMVRLASRPDALIRPSPSALAPGGVSDSTRETVLLCEAAGFDVVLVETVGVGQGETEVAGMVDLLLLLLEPGAGDDIQGIKRGILEVADFVAVNKADGGTAERAAVTAASYGSALSIVRGRQAPGVAALSSLVGDGVEGACRWDQRALVPRPRFRGLGKTAAESGREVAQRSDQQGAQDTFRRGCGCASQSL